VRDPAAPSRVAQATLAGSSSGAEWDHHAFLWWPDTNLVAIPVSAFEATPFEGLVGYGVDTEAASITERGRIAHPGQVDGAGPGPASPLPVEPGAGGGSPGEPGGQGVAGSPGEPGGQGGAGGGPSRDSGGPGGADEPGGPSAAEVAPELSYTPPIVRSLVVGDRLWTLSSAGLASSDLVTLGSTTFLAFPR
jgi:hypothetical protein